MTIESNLRQPAHGVRTFRGRTLEELLPQIRAELGADAIILREREGLVGGIGGFFAQRFIEVDARRGEGQSIDIYDDSPEDDLRLTPDDGDVRPTERHELLPPEPVALGPAPPPVLELPIERPATPPAEAPTARSQPRPFVPPSIQIERPAAEQPSTVPRAFETDVFLERLRQAASDLPEDSEPFAIPEPEATAPTAPPQRRPIPERAPRPQRAPRQRPTAEPRSATRPPIPGQARRSVTQPADLDPGNGAAQPIEALLRAMAPPETRPQAQVVPQPALEMRAVEQVRPAPVAPAPVAPALVAPALVAPASDSTEPVRQRPSSLRTNLPTGEEFPGAFAGTPFPTGNAMPFAPPLDLSPKRPESRVRSAISRLFGGRRQPGIPRPAPPQPLDVEAATQLAHDMSSRGASQAWASQLISTAGAHGSPLAESLQAAAEAEVARRIVAAPALPVTGAAVAFIGSGGSGKTRCTAALASAYRHGSTLGVTVVAIDNPDGARELHRLLGGDHVPVLSLTRDEAVSVIAEARKDGFVVVDTPTTTPTDPYAIQALGQALEPLELDATYVTLPATLGSQAARRALAGFGKLRPTAVAITHADETDQLAVAVEIAVLHRIPLAYIHSGTDHSVALAAIDAPVIAQRVMS